MGNYFEVPFDGTTVLVSKSDVKFKYGYGVFEALYYSSHNGRLCAIQLIGIVDSNYEVINVDPKYLMPKIEIFPNDIFIY